MRTVMYMIHIWQVWLKSRLRSTYWSSGAWIKLEERPSTWGVLFHVPLHWGSWAELKSPQWNALRTSTLCPVCHTHKLCLYRLVTAVWNSLIPYNRCLNLESEDACHVIPCYPSKKQPKCGHDIKEDRKLDSEWFSCPLAYWSLFKCVSAKKAT